MHPCLVITALATVIYLVWRKGLNPFRRIRVSLRMSIFWPLQVGPTAFLSFLSLHRVEVLKFPEWLSKPHEESKMSWAFPLYTRKIRLLTLKCSHYACLMITTPSDVWPSTYKWLMFVLIDFPLPERELWQGVLFFPAVRNELGVKPLSFCLSSPEDGKSQRTHGRY